MFLKKVRICNFKSFRQEEIEFVPGFNCITGQNGVGNNIEISLNNALKTLL
jgi:chromosome segregation ATPase